MKIILKDLEDKGAPIEILEAFDSRLNYLSKKNGTPLISIECHCPREVYKWITDHFPPSGKKTFYRGVYCSNKHIKETDWFANKNDAIGWNFKGYKLARIEERIEDIP